MATSKMVKKDSDKKPRTDAQLAAQRVREREMKREMESDKEMTPSMLRRIKEMLAPSKRNPVAGTASEEAMRNMAKESMSKEQLLRAIEREKKTTKAEREAKRLDTPGFKKGGMVTARGQGRVTRKKSTRIC